MSSSATTSPSSTAVRELLDQYIAAVQRLDLAALADFYAPDVVAYDAIAQLEFKGRDAYLAHWKTCLDCCQSMIFKPHQPSISVSGDVAFGFYLLECGGAGPNGTVETGWMRASFAARRQDGRWQIVHEHYSMPFDPVTMKVITGLTPAAAAPAGAR